MMAKVKQKLEVTFNSSTPYEEGSLTRNTTLNFEIDYGNPSPEHLIREFNNFLRLLGYDQTVVEVK